MTRVGVFICHCGKNIAGAADPKKLVKFAKTQQDVVYAKDNRFLCSEQGQESVKKAVKKHKLEPLEKYFARSTRCQERGRKSKKPAPRK